MLEPMIIRDEIKVYVDEWIPDKEDIIFNHGKEYYSLPVSEFYGYQQNDLRMLDIFYISKKCYNGVPVRKRICKYLNYFLKFYDYDKELLSVYYKMKMYIDFESSYDINAFKYDVRTYLLSPSIQFKVKRMVLDNYKLNLSKEVIKNPALRYNDIHGKIFMEMSILMNILIPITCQFGYVKGIKDINAFFKDIFDNIFTLYDVDENGTDAGNYYKVDIYNKLFETVTYNINRLHTNNIKLWNMQAIRGVNTGTHILDTIENIILNTMPKYVFNDNLLSLNTAVIKRTHGWQIQDVEYSHSFIPLSSNQRDDDNNSKFDKYESFITREDESLYLQNKVNCAQSMKTIEEKFGPFSEEEMDFYRQNVETHGFQEKLIFLLFHKYFGNPVSIKQINKDDYIKLIISAKRHLQSHQLYMMSYVISSNITRFVNRKSLNKKEGKKTQSSPTYELVRAKYRTEKIEKEILSIIASILSSEFEIQDFDNPDITGKPLEKISDLICEEVLLYTLLI